MENIKDHYISIILDIVSNSKVTNKNKYYQFLLLVGELNEECFQEILNTDNILSNFNEEDNLKEVLQSIRRTYKILKDLEGFNYIVENTEKGIDFKNIS